MVVYEFECRKCRKHFEDIQHPNRRVPAKCECGGLGRQVYGRFAISVDFTPGYDDFLGAYVDTKQQREEILRESNLVRRRAYG